MYYIYGLYKKNIKYKTNTLKENLFYVGISSSDKNFYFRIKNHKKEKSNPYKLNTIAKYDFIIRVFWQVDSKEEAETREEFLIRWFGRKVNKAGCLTNILTSSKDYSHIHTKKTQATKNKISKALKKINQNQNKIIANRDRNLTMPYDKVIELIEEWAMNPLETQQDFATRMGIKRSKFKDWLRLYRPNYIGLTKQKQLEIFNKVYNKNKLHKDIISLYMAESGYSYKKAKSVYNRLINKLKSIKKD
jgi:uncharacterized protein (DUF2344 family)